MANLNIRNIDPEVLRRFKVYAAEKGRTMSGLVVEFMATMDRVSSVKERVTKEEETGGSISTARPKISLSDLRAMVSKIEGKAFVEEEVMVLPGCPYTEYDTETGESYGCRLPVHGAKVKHQRGPAL